MYKLYFRPSELEGFTAVDLADKKEGYAVPIRELLQNSLDASHLAENEKCEVNIYIEKISKSEIPCIDEYEEVLGKAKATQEKEKSYNRNAKRVVSLIENELCKSDINILMFADNGAGMPPKTIEALMGKRSRKGDEGSAGSYGVGHLTSYRLSALRYVLYATKYKDEESGRIKTLFTGSPILAGHSDEDVDHGNSGRIVTKKPNNELKPSFTYPDNFPGFIERRIRDIENGTMVVMLGLPEGWRNDAEYSIASNFFHAIVDKKLAVTIHTTEGKKQIDSNKAAELIESHKGNQRATGENILSGKAVYDCWQAINTAPKVIELDERNNVSVYIKNHVEANSTIALVRNGMLIARHNAMLSNDVDNLRKSVDFEPFAAVIDVDQKSAPDLFELVKDSESQHHNKLEQLLPPESIKRLRGFFKNLCKMLERYLEKIDRESFALEVFSVQQAGTAEEARGVAAGQSKRASPRPNEPRPRVKKNKVKKKKRKVTRNSDSISVARYVDGGETWTAYLTVADLKKDNSGDDVYLSFRLAEDSDYGKATRFLQINAIECNGESVDFSADEARHPCLGNLQQNKQYEITATVNKPEDIRGLKVALVPTLGLKRQIKVT